MKNWFHLQPICRFETKIIKSITIKAEINRWIASISYRWSWAHSSYWGI